MSAALHTSACQMEKHVLFDKSEKTVRITAVWKTAFSARQGEVKNGL